MLPQAVIYALGVLRHKLEVKFNDGYSYSVIFGKNDLDYKHENHYSSRS